MKALSNGERVELRDVMTFETKIQKKSRYIRNEIWNYKQSYLGYNYRMTDIQAALGLSQSKRLSNIIERRNKLLENYNNLLDAYKLPISLLKTDENILSAVHLAVIQLQKGFEHKHFGLFMKFREMK